MVLRRFGGGFLRPQARLASQPPQVTQPGLQFDRAIEDSVRAPGSSDQAFPPWEAMLAEDQRDAQDSRRRPDLNIVIDAIPPTSTTPGVIVRTESGRQASTGKVFSARTVRIWNPFTKSVWISEVVNIFDVQGLVQPPGTGGIQPAPPSGSGGRVSISDLTG